MLFLMSQPNVWRTSIQGFPFLLQALPIPVSPTLLPSSLLLPSYHPSVPPLLPPSLPPSLPTSHLAHVTTSLVAISPHLHPISGGTCRSSESTGPCPGSLSPPGCPRRPRLFLLFCSAARFPRCRRAGPCCCHQGPHGHPCPCCPGFWGGSAAVGAPIGQQRKKEEC